ncbi:MAG: PorV/PorQ family protein [Flavobacteriales bacterium]|nr:PorV/PorQ family protein [Flavobacteriales bacterium]
MRIIIVFFGLCFSTLTWSQNFNAPKYSNEFMNIGIGARALGMSNAVVTSTNDATSSFWNPGHLTEIDNDLQISLMHSEYFAGIAKFDFGSIAKTIDDKSAFGVSFIRFGVDNIPNTTELIDAQGNVNYDRISYFSAADMAFLLSYGRKIKDNWMFGGSAKIIHRKVGDFASAWGFGFDLSSTYYKDSWVFSCVARDVTSTFNSWNYQLSDQMIETFTLTGNEIPQNSLELTLPRIILGASKNFEFKNNLSLLVELNSDITTDGQRNVLIVGDPFSIDPHLGAELNINNYVFLRTGLGNIQKTYDLNNKSIVTIQPNIGVGLQIKGITIDYALTDIGDASVALYSNVFSLRINLNPN